MSDGEIKVTVIRYPDRANLVLCYIDPVSGKRKTKSAGQSNEKDGMEGRGGMGRGIAGGSALPTVESDLGSNSASGTKRNILQTSSPRRGNRPAMRWTR